MVSKVQEVGSPTVLRTKACGDLYVLGGCQGSDAGITQAKVSSALHLQRAGGCHMFSSRLLTWSQNLLPDGSSANGFQVCPWAPGGDILEDTPPPTQVPLLWSPSATEPGPAWGTPVEHRRNLTAGGMGIKGHTVSFSDWLLSSEPLIKVTSGPWYLQCKGPRGKMKVVPWKKMAGRPVSLGKGVGLVPP